MMPLNMLRREAATAGLAGHRADKRDRAGVLLGYATMLREVARRTGEADALAKAASAAERAASEAEGPTLISARLEQVAGARLKAELFADASAIDAAETWLTAAEQAKPPSIFALRRAAHRAAFTAARALHSRDLDEAVQAAGPLDEAVDRFDAFVRDTAQGKAEAAALRCERADFLIGFGARLKDKALLMQAENDLAQLAKRLDPAYLPLTWARVEGLRGEALAGLGDLTGDATCLAEAVRVLAAAADHVDFDHSPLDRARLSHALARALEALAEACDDDGLFDHALSAFDQAMVVLEPSQAHALRARAAYDRAACVARRAEKDGDPRALALAESALKAELSREDGPVDPVSWAVAQLGLARVYDARAAVEGGAPRPDGVAVALTEALDVFTEQGLKTLAEAAQDALERLRGA
ncbi:MAG: hypothetical protein B7Y99_02890 [Caulobacterales bacterium 32-69-10]|nr:MAG: hypothetical protein B7Y99_02890 [Caulobacterales bacterium 32-69-10]